METLIDRCESFESPELEALPGYEDLSNDILSIDSDDSLNLNDSCSVASDSSVSS